MTTKRCIFIGYDRSVDPRQRLERTRKHMAILLGMPYADFQAGYAWMNLYGENAAPEKGNVLEDARHAHTLIENELGGYERAVLLGNDVAAAFHCCDQERYRWEQLDDAHDLQVARIPHTSLRNWNHSDRWGRGRGPWVEEAQEFLDDLRRYAAGVSTGTR